nr:MAG TPA: hypothetical protein [Caudoviricetes sp.]
MKLKSKNPQKLDYEKRNERQKLRGESKRRKSNL